LKWRIEKAGIFKLQARLPQGFELESALGHAAAGTNPPKVESQFVENGLLTLNLASQAIGETAVRIILVRKLTEPALQMPGAGETTLEIPLARVAESGVETQKGVVELTENAALQRMKGHGSPRSPDGLPRAAGSSTATAHRRSRSPCDAGRPTSPWASCWRPRWKAVVCSTATPSSIPCPTAA
jgi:hypothetical protein